MNSIVNVGDKFPTWFSDSPDGMSTIIDILPYTGRYTKDFNCILVLTAPRTKAGVFEMTYKRIDH